jgi:sulfate adenylyltransferase
VDEKWPTHHPSRREVADAELLASGALAPVRGFQRPDSSGPAVTLRVETEVAASAQQSGGLVLVDEEGAPVGSIASPELVPTADGAWVVGEVAATAVPASGPFRRLHRPPTGPKASPRAAVLLDRPLLSGEWTRCRALAREHGGLTLLLRSVDPVVPIEVLVKSVLVLTDTEPAVEVVITPLASRPDTRQQQTLAERVAANHGLVLHDVFDPASSWDGVREALKNDDAAALEDAVGRATARVLQWWRPPRSRRGVTVFFTGLSGSGKSTVARGLLDRLHETDRTITSVDGDVARRMLSAGLTFSRADRDLNIRRIGWVAAEVTRHGGVAVCAPIAPFAETRAAVRGMVEENGDFVLVHISTPLHECERRDRKGLYAKARRGEIPDFTGISSPYEEPTDAQLRIDTTEISVDAAVDQVLSYLVDGGWLPAHPPA